MPRPCCADLPLTAAADGVRVAVQLTPRARAERIERIVRLSDGSAVVKVAVSAPPAEGRANEALLRLLSREWKMPRRDLAIIGGHASRRKLVHVAGNPGALLRQLAAALANLPRA